MRGYVLIQWRRTPYGLDGSCDLAIYRHFKNSISRRERRDRRTREKKGLEEREILRDMRMIVTRRGCLSLSHTLFHQV